MRISAKEYKCFVQAYKLTDRFVPRNAPWRIHPHSCLSPPNALVRKKWLTLADQPATPRIRLLPIHTFS